MGSASVIRLWLYGFSLLMLLLGAAGCGFAIYICVKIPSLFIYCCIIAQAVMMLDALLGFVALHSKSSCAVKCFAVFTFVLAAGHIAVVVLLFVKADLAQQWIDEHSGDSLQVADAQSFVRSNFKALAGATIAMIVLEVVSFLVTVCGHDQLTEHYSIVTPNRFQPHGYVQLDDPPAYRSVPSYGYASAPVAPSRSYGYGAASAASQSPSAVLVRQQVSVGAQAQLYVVTLVLDVSGSMSGAKWQKCVAGVHRILEQMHDLDIVAAVTFNDNVEVVSGLSAKKDSNLARAINRVSTGGGTHLYDALLQGMLLSLTANSMTPDQIQNIRLKHILILITDGEDTGSMTPISKCEQMLSELPEGMMEVLLIGVGLDSSGRNALQRLDRAGGRSARFIDAHNADSISDVFSRIALVLQRRIDVLAISGE